MGDQASRDQQITEQFRRITEGAAQIASKDLLGYLKGALLSVDEALRQPLEDLLLAYSRAPSRREKHVIAVVHGIRTRATWFQPLATLLEAIPGVTATPLLYGYFDVFRFLLPIVRRGPIRHLKQQIALIARENEDSHVSVIAHSFGTYAVCKLLQEEAGIRLYRVVLCGSIVPPRFAWHQIAGLVEKKPIVNECATRDVWPILAGTSTWGYGPSGTYGFEHMFVTNRYYDLPHSGFFAREFYEESWLPLWRNPESNPSQPAGRRPESPKWLHLVGLIPIKWLALIVVMIAVGSAVGCSLPRAHARKLADSNGWVSANGPSITVRFFP